MSSQARARSYYDEFSDSYERHRHQGYHQFLDDLEVSLARDYCQGRVLEAGCGTGLILRRLAVGALQAVGLDLSAGMLSWARRRGLSVTQGSVDALPFPDACFDAVVSFKVLAHIPPIAEAIAEFARVTRPGGHLVLEFYNRRSLRALIKRIKLPTRIGQTYTDADVYTRYDALSDILGYLSPELTLKAVHGVRVVTPVAHVHDLPVVRDLFSAVERFAASAPLLRHLGGFLVVVLQKRA
jgi:ubiquinone/menaquinone biosynthesis C-methylase UbiE